MSLVGRRGTPRCCNMADQGGCSIDAEHRPNGNSPLKQAVAHPTRKGTCGTGTGLHPPDVLERLRAQTQQGGWQALCLTPMRDEDNHTIRKGRN